VITIWLLGSPVIRVSMTKLNITKRAIDAIQRKEKDQYLWDQSLKGFGLKVTTGGRKVFLIQYRSAGRTRRVTIGKFSDPWTAGSARKEAKKLLGLVASGKDPAEEISEARRDITIAQLCDTYVDMADEGKILTKSGRPKSGSTLATDRGRIERHIKPLLGRRKLGSLTQADIRRFQNDVSDGKTATDERTGKHGRAIVTGGKGTAARTVGLLGGIISFGIEHGYCSENPVHGVRRFKDRSVNRRLSTAELEALGQALKIEEDRGTNPKGLAIIRLLLLTGCRKGEIESLKWDYCDFDRGLLMLPDSKTGEKVVPIGAVVVELLKKQSQGDSAFVFPAENREGFYLGLPKVWSRVRKKARLSDVRLHDLRHSFASVAVDEGFSLYIVGSVLGHKDPSTTQRYSHLADDPRSATVQAVSNKLSRALGA
jgi:integrase